MTAERRGYVPTKSDEALKNEAKNIVPRYPVLGIIGGMGPAATNDLFGQITRLTGEYKQVKGDQDQLSAVINSFPEIPDRTKFILHEMGLSDEAVNDPFPYLISSAQKLLAGDPKPQVVGIPCNTAHYFVTALEEFLSREGHSIEIVHMIRETASDVQKRGIKTVGLLATTGTLQTRLYHNFLEDAGIEVLVPSEEDQELLVMDGIYGGVSGKGVKNGYIEEPRQKFLQISERLVGEGAEAIIEGCTEIPIALTQDDTDIVLINPTEILARVMIRKSIAKGK